MLCYAFCCTVRQAVPHREACSLIVRRSILPSMMLFLRVMDGHARLAGTKAANPNQQDLLSPADCASSL